MGPDNVEREFWQEQYVCLEIHDRLGARSSAEQLVACTQEELNSRIASIAPHCEPSSKNASISLPECRICHEEEDLSQLETPCDCSGTLKYAHRSCVQRWCDEKGDTICEICQQPYKHGYSVSESDYRAGDVTLDISDAWGMELQDPRILALAAAQRRFLESDYQEFAAVNSVSAACCRSVVLVLMALLLLRHATAMATATGNEDAFMFVLIFLLRVVGFLLPCYILIRAMNMLQQGQQAQAAAMTVAEVSLMLQARHPRGIRLALVPAAVAIP